MSDNTLIHALLNQLEQPTQLLQTHISWVILSGENAYKIKKPVNFGFIDYTSVEKRKHYCELEIALNKRLAESLYLEVLPITGTPQSPQLGGTGHPIEYAVKMRAFDQSQLFSNLIAHHDLTIQHIETISDLCSKFHQAAEVCRDPVFGTPESLIQPMLDNFDVTAQLPAGKNYLTQLAIIREWVETTYQTLLPHLTKRKTDGFIRACHGDLHLGNMVLFDNKPMIFDCIEFNESFRWTDVMSDVGFFAMDLEDKQRPDLASRFVNRYLDITNDYDGVILLNFYQSYRAMVRAKIAAIQLEQSEKDTPAQKALQDSLKSCIDLALSYTQPHQPQLILTHGVSGSGKTTYTNQLLNDTHTIRISSDVIRKHLFGLPPFEPSLPSLQSKLYSNEAHEKVFYKLRQIAETLLLAKKTVIVDATFIRRVHRNLFTELARQLKVGIKALRFNTPESMLMHRHHLRQFNQTASDANFEIAKEQLAALEPILPEEGLAVIDINE